MRFTIAYDHPILVTGISKMTEIWLRLPLNTPLPHPCLDFRGV